MDFMYKGETSVPETQLTGLIKAAEGLKVRGLTSADHGNVIQRPMDPAEFARSRHYHGHRSPSPYRHAHGGGGGEVSPPHPKLAGISSTSGPVCLSDSSVEKLFPLQRDSLAIFRSATRASNRARSA